MSTEINIGGIRFTGGKLFAVLTALSSAAGIVWGAALFWDDYEGLKKKLRNLDPDGITVQVDTSMIKVEEAISYAKDIKEGLRDDVINVEKAMDDVESAMRDVEGRNRQAISEAKGYFDERVSLVDSRAKENELSNRKYIQELQKQFDGRLDALNAAARANEKADQKAMQDFKTWFEGRIKATEAQFAEQIKAVSIQIKNNEADNRKVLQEAQQLLVELEERNRQSMTASQKWVDERIVSMDAQMKELEERMNKRIDRALTNILADQ